MDNSTIIILLTAIGIPVLNEVFPMIRKMNYWKKVRLNYSLMQTFSEDKNALLQKLSSYFSFEPAAQKNWLNDNIVIIKRFGNQRPEIEIKTKTALRLDIPDEYKRQIESYYPEFDTLDLEDNMMEEAREVLEKEYRYYYSDSKKRNSRSVDEILEYHKSQVAETFVKRLKSSKICFNNEMYGLLGFSNSSPFKMEFYKTDFFTFQVFQSIHQELSTNPKCGINNIRSEKELLYYKVFLCSFGINTFLVTDKRECSEILFAKRSKYNIGAGIYKNRYHYSMNEAFSITDNSPNQTNESFVECIKRGLNEELGIPTNIEANKTVLMDFKFSKKLMQVGISSVCYFDNINSNDVRNCYKGAKDGRLETDDLVFVPYKKKKLKPLIYLNSIPKVEKPRYKDSSQIDSLTDEARLGLFQLTSRYPKVSYLKKAKAQYFDRG